MKNISLVVIALVTVFASGVVASFVAQSSSTNTKPTLGALAGPDIPSPYISFGDVRQFAARTSVLTAATTTVCALQSPAATSTLIAGGINFSVSSTSASTVTIAKATTAYATTTLINSASVGANAQATILAASTTVSALEQTNRIFAPNTYLVVGMAGGVGTFSPSGNCEAVWVQNSY